MVDERVALEALLPRLNRRIAVAELTEQPCGAFDVAEEEGQRAARRLGHEGYSGGSGEGERQRRTTGS